MMTDLLRICAFNAAYAETIDSDDLEAWPDYFTQNCHYRITHVENEKEGLPAGIVYATSRAMLQDRVSALREANIYERQRYRHLIGVPLILRPETGGVIEAKSPFMVARIMTQGETQLFATGSYHDQFVVEGEQLLLARRVAICDSSVSDTLLALPL